MTRMETSDVALFILGALLFLAVLTYSGTGAMR